MTSNDYEYGEYPEHRPYYRYEENGEKKVMALSFYKGLARVWPSVMDDKDRAKFVMECRNYLDTARAIHEETGGDAARLKSIMDDARVHIHEIPERIPRGGFASFEAITYPDTITIDELEKRILAEVERMGLTRWYVLSGDPRVKQ